ncbi:hypothetical protein OsI_37031 [Oryza sativa Indica Group]|uniref:Os11g0700400 protein n=2 Tax=Oryza sativa TaxID=4530 RepID=Q0IQY6_ORYSJ|nr:hypothetical protein OsI_37031 [Oryza sativa Indica Group]BAF28879.1 Os11g0700400 [Oryza sativa Japonica Group]|eukprot:NP_001068516.1 Os11g0700400 [Oryza sativa Japonica Group]
MGLLSPMGKPTRSVLLDLAAGALIPEPAISIKGTFIPKAFQVINDPASES